MICLTYYMLITMAIVSGCITGVQFIKTVIGFETFIDVGSLNHNNFVGLINGCVTVAMTILGFTITIAISAPAISGLYNCFYKISKKQITGLEDLFSGFYLLKKNVFLYVLQTILILRSALFLVVPGILSILNYSQAFFILHDHPDMKEIEILRQSKRMMYGYRKKFFLLQLSFLGWLILGVLSLGIGFLWILPYKETTFANFYQEIKEAYLQKCNQNKIIHISVAKEKRMITIVNQYS